MNQITYTHKIGYEITKIDKTVYGLYGDPLTPSELIRLKHDRNTELKEKLQELTAEAYKTFNIKQPYRAKTEHYKQCWGIAGIKKVSLKYRLSGFAVLSITVDHWLSNKEHQTLESSIEAQMIDGYGENPFPLFSDNNYDYQLEI